MKKQDKIVTALVVLFAMLSAAGYAEDVVTVKALREEYAASWEDEASAQIMIEQMGEGTPRGRKSRINGLWAVEEIRAVRRILEEAKREVAGETERGEITLNGVINHDLFVAAREALAEENGNKEGEKIEKEFLRIYTAQGCMVKKITRAPFLHSPNKGGIEESIETGAVLSERTKKNESARKKETHQRPRTHIVKVNHPIYMETHGKVDYYRLYLYLWEDCPWVCKAIYILPAETSLHLNQDQSSNRLIKNIIHCIQRNMGAGVSHDASCVFRNHRHEKSTHREKGAR